MQLEGAVALVTGGASGLGLATARGLAAAGASVVLVDLPTTDGARAAESIDGHALFVAADVVDQQSMQSAVDRAVEIGPLRVAVNCAGVATAGRVVGRGRALPLEQFENVVTVNLIGTFNVLRLAAMAMTQVEPVDGERGVIINTSSVAAFDGQIGQAAYSASKAGVAGMTLPLARDLADNLIRVMTIAPGMFETAMLLGLPESVRQSLTSQAPMPSRAGDPAEFAALVRHICENPMLNGEVIRLDGAIRMGPR